MSLSIRFSQTEILYYTKIHHRTIKKYLDYLVSEKLMKTLKSSDGRQAFDYVITAIGIRWKNKYRISEMKKEIQEKKKNEH